MCVILRFVSGGDWDSHVIRWYTDSEWSHVEAVYGDRTFGAMLKGGVKWRNFDDPEYRNVKRMAYKHLSCTQEQETRFWRFQRAQEGKPYDWQGIFRFSPILRLLIHERDWRRWFCSDLQLASLESAEIAKMPHGDALRSTSPAILYAMVEQLKMEEFSRCQRSI